MQKQEQLELADPEYLSMIYFLMHTIISALMFYLIVWLMGVRQFDVITLSLTFFINVAIVFMLSLLCSATGRFISYQILKLIAKHGFERRVKRWSTFFEGVNGMPRSFFIATAISATVYVGGLTYVFTGILGSNFASTFGAYILMEFIILGLSKIIDVMLRG
jgi:hypothetical protein